MEFEEVLKKRRSTRKFKEDEIPDEKILEILQLSQLAPSAGNIQAYKIKIVKTDVDKNRIKEATFTSQGQKQEWIFKAPVIFVICADLKESEARFGERGNNFYAIQDATIFTSYLQLVITSMGLASGWVGNFNEEELKKILDIPEELKIIALIPFGYPDVEPGIFNRKEINQILLS